MAGFDTWESYFQPAPNDSTLRNIPGLRTESALESFECAATAERQRELLADPSLVEHTFDAAHLRQIHRHLFQDVYEWAGEYRTQNMGRAGDFMGFALAENGEIDRYLEVVNAEVVNTRWASLDRDDFAGEAAKVFVYLNQAHPFREGNGRASKMFMHHVAMRSLFELDFARVHPTAWNRMSAMSRPQPGRVSLAPEEIAPAFLHAARERTATQTPAVEAASLRSVSYPRAATQATQPGVSQHGRDHGRGGAYMPGRGHGPGAVER